MNKSKYFDAHFSHDWKTIYSSFLLLLHVWRAGELACCYAAKTQRPRISPPPLLCTLAVGWLFGLKRASRFVHFARKLCGSPSVQTPPELDNCQNISTATGSQSVGTEMPLLRESLAKFAASFRSNIYHLRKRDKSRRGIPHMRNNRPQIRALCTDLKIRMASKSCHHFC